MSYPPIENYGVIGDLHTVALVGIDGSIDFMCWPHFDSPSVFAALLDRERGGHFRLAPVLEDARHKQIYLPDSNVLLSRFLSHDGVAEISDFMPIEDEAAHSHDVVRRAKTVRGQIRYRMACAPRFDYGRADHAAEQRGEREVLFTSRGRDGLALRLRSTVRLEIAGGEVTADFTLGAGETAAFVLEQVMPGEPSPSEAPDFVSESFKRTVNFWRAWVGRSRYQGRWQEMVNRSALTLKLLTSRPHGSIVAAPTFGLPEEIGGERNWDYRYTWIRDASFTLYALSRLGYTEESTAFMKWLQERYGDLGPDGTLQIMYGIDGRRHLEESTLDHLEGYMRSSPVRIGNGAYTHLQLDIYGELMDAVYLHDKYGEPIHHDLWKSLVRLVDWVVANWRQPDEGIWEVRGGRRDFLFSRVMCWVAVDRGLRLAQKRSLPAPFGDWRRARDEIYDSVFRNFWDPEQKSFVQYEGGRALDASSLLMPLVRFVSPTDPRWLSTLRAIEELLVDDSLVYRYRTEAKAGSTSTGKGGNAPAVVAAGAADGLSGSEGTFSMCSFWFVECLSRAGDLHKARLYFEKMLGYANHLGLYAEELGPCGEHLGNFPQAFTHIALISAAYDLNRRLSAAGYTG